MWNKVLYKALQLYVITYQLLKLVHVKTVFKYLLSNTFLAIILFQIHTKVFIKKENRFLFVGNTHQRVAAFR